MYNVLKKNEKKSFGRTKKKNVISGNTVNRKRNMREEITLTVLKKKWDQLEKTLYAGKRYMRETLYRGSTVLAYRILVYPWYFLVYHWIGISFFVLKIFPLILIKLFFTNVYLRKWPQSTG